MTPREARRAARGFTLIELAVVVCVIGILGVAALDRLQYYQEQAEKAQVEADLEAFKMALRIRVSELTIGGRGEAIPALAAENPIAWLAAAPANYEGAYHASPAPGWYFSAQSKELIYVPKTARHLETGGAERELRFRVKTGQGAQAASSEATFLPVTPYRWF